MGQGLGFRVRRVSRELGASNVSNAPQTIKKRLNPADSQLSVGVLGAGFR